MLYLIVIVVAMLLITLTGSLLMPLPSWELTGKLALSVLLGTVSVIAWDGIQALFIRRFPLPRRWFAPERAIFCAGKRERKLYRSIGINVWKDYVPELGCFTAFQKSDFSSPSDPAYLGRFLLESNYGVVIHLFNALLGPLIVLLPWCSAPGVAYPIAAVNFVLSLLPVAILRFNNTPLRNLYLRGKKQVSDPS